MKTLLNLLNRTANAVKISGGGSSHTTKHLFAIVTLLLTFGVGNMWANYAYLDLSGFTQWYEKGENGTVDPDFTVSISSDHCNKVQVNGNSGVWRFSIGDESGTAYFKRRHKDQCNGKWNECSGTVNASQNVMHVTGWDNSGEMRTAFVINYIHGTNHVYFDNSISNFTDNIYLVIGHDYAPNGSDNKYSSVYLMEPVTGTNLYHAEVTSTWQDANYYAIIASATEEGDLNSSHDWGSSSLSTKGTSGYTAAFKTVYNMEEGAFLITTASSGNDQAMNINWYDGHSNLPKYNASQAAKKRDTGTTYSDVVGSWLATLKLRGSYMKNATDTARSTITSTASTDGDGNKTYSAIQSGLITQSYTGLDANYYFEGWGTESTPTNKETTNEYHISENTTVYAFFSKLYTLTYDRKGDYSTSTVTCYSVVDYSGAKTSGSSIPTGHLITIVATPATGYEVKGWYSDASCTSAYTNGDGGVTIESGNNTFKLESLDANTGVYPKFGPKTYTINLVGMEATTPGTTSVDVTYNASTHMTASDPIAKPTKNGYTFGGYWTSENTGATLDHQLIDADGKWIADVEGYTGNDGDDPTWVHDYAISLYAKWTEIKHTVNVAVSPAGAGSVQVNSSNVSTVTNVGISTKSAEMSPIALPGWKFKEWQATSNVQMDLVNYHSDYQQGTANKMKINATADEQTITAVFEPRYYLVGKIWDDSADGGMPGWDNYNKPFKVVTTSPVLDTCKLTLSTNKSFYIEVRDKVDGFSYGKSGGISLGDDASITFTDKDNKVLFYSNGGTNYTFKITAVDGSGRPTVSVERPHQMHFAHKRVDIDGNDYNDDLGGTLTATINGESAAHEQWFDYGSDVVWTATAETGYSLTWYTDNAYSNAMNPQPEASWNDPDITHDENIFAKFTEKATTVTINTNNTRGGTITVGGEAFTWGSTKTAGVTTKRALVVTENTGYNFTSWALSSTPDFELQDKVDDTDKEVTLAGKGGTNGSLGTLTANFTAKTYTVKLNNDHEGTSSDDGTATATYDATSLSSITHAQFSGWTLLGYWNSSAVQVADAEGNLKKDVTNYTDGDGKWKYDGDVSLWAHWSRSVTLDDNGGSADGSVTVTYKGTAGTPSAPKKTGYHVEAYYAEEGLTNKVMEANGTLVNYSGYVTDGKWVRGEATTLYTKWAPDTYTVTLHNDHEGESSDDGTATATYDATTLSSITDAKFIGWTLLGYWNSSAVQVADAEGNLKASVTGFTDGSGKWTKTGNAEVWAHWTRTITLDDNVSQLHNGSVSVTYKGAAASHSAPHSREGYTLDGYYAEAACTTKVMNSNGTLVASVSGYTDATPNWIHKTAATLYTKWTSDHFIIYRTDDKSDDPRKLSTDVESYAGGELDKAIEFRMKVRERDTWYTLCLPFTVNAVKVWDEEDCAYYPIVPYYRSGGTFYNGHYIIRTPDPGKRTGLPIAEFDDWRDPESAGGYVPSKDVPYIIQWHDSYFTNRYISFFGATGQTIATAFSEGSYADANDKVNVYGNNTMHSGSVTGAYMLEPDYGSDGAWLRLEDASAARTILPFECFVRASETTTQQALVIRRDMIICTPTGFDKIMPDKKQTNKVIINGQLFVIRDNKMYNIYGKEVQQ